MGLGSEIRDPEKTYSGSRIQGSKKHRIPDPGSATLINFRGKMTGGLSDKLRGGLGGEQPPVVKYCQFPPEGAGNVSVSNEDYACLEVEQFLNDVIIDFYLK